MGLTFRRVVEALETDVGDTHGESLTKADRRLRNKDTLPLAPEHRTWTSMVYIAFWFAGTSSVSNWYGVSAAVSTGLSAWEALFTMFGGGVLAGAFMLLTGRPGAQYGIPMPALVRSCFGIYGAAFPIVIRASLSIIYNGLNLVQGAECVYVMLHAIFPSIANLRNVMPAAAGIDTGDLIGILILWCLTVIALFIPVPRFRYIIYIKVAAFFISAIALMAWCGHLAGGLNHVSSLKGTATGSTRQWLLVRFFFVGIASSATFITDAADFQRYSQKPTSPILGMLVGGSVANLLVRLFGVLVSASSQIIFGELVWNPVELIDRIQTENYTPANRAGCFFIGLLFVFSSIITMVLENSLPVGNDLAGLWPRFINYRRATLICAVVSLCMNPWYLLTTASTFLAYITSFGVFLAPFIGIIVAQYFVLVRGYINTHDLYSADKNAMYHYTRGFNWRAFVTVACALAPNIYGFLGNVGAMKITTAGTHAYYFMYEIGFFTAFFLYLILCYFFPIPAQVPFTEKGWREVPQYGVLDAERDSTAASASDDLEGRGPVSKEAKMDVTGV